MPGNMRGCGRGIFGLSSWEPLRKPGERNGRGPPVNTANLSPRQEEETSPAATASPIATTTAPATKEAATTMAAGGDASSSSQNQPVKDTGTKKDPRIGRKMISRYSYTANGKSPIGEELSLEQMEEVTFVSDNDNNEHWWVARNDRGMEGYVPVRYMHFVEKKPSGLPWLANKELIEGKPAPPPEPAQKLEYKGYKSAYDKNDEKIEGSSEYRCDICEKTLNGPMPYRSHMNSKTHKEMVEFMNS